MKKKICLLCALALLCLITALIFSAHGARAVLETDGNGALYLSIQTNGRSQQLYPYADSDNGRYYFFLPSCMKNSTITIGRADSNKILADGKSSKGRRLSDWADDETHKILVMADDGYLTHEYKTVFMCSENIPAVFIDTDSHSMAYLHENKENEESGYISVLEENGNMQYSGKLERVSGRGNSSWNFYPKKSYSIKLKNSKALLGMTQGKKWCLLPLWKEESRMSTKLAFDIASELGLKYTPEGTWIDLYLNGEYNGNYLLCTAVSVGDGRVEINDLEKENKADNPNILNAPRCGDDTYKGYELENASNADGGYLVEKDYSPYYKASPSGFLTKQGYCFSLKSPEHASKAQIEYIKDYFQTIEDMIINSEPDFDNYIDLDSFAARFLVDEITLNFDSNVTSMYFYKEKGSSMLYAGPVWDYDSSMGWGKLGSGEWADYEQSTLNNLREEALNWYQFLYQDETFYNKVVDDFNQLLPYMETILKFTIDEYADTVRASTIMDECRWQTYYVKSNVRGHYDSLDNNIRYLKFFLSKRINFLCERWKLPHEEFELQNTGELHEISFIKDGAVIETRLVPDGDELDASSFPYLDEDKYFGWAWYNAENKVYRGKLPIYEDCAFYPRAKEE